VPELKITEEELRDLAMVAHLAVMALHENGWDDEKRLTPRQIRIKSVIVRILALDKENT
jgi:hypothetical protein